MTEIEPNSEATVKEIPFSPTHNVGKTIQKTENILQSSGLLNEGESEPYEFNLCTVKIHIIMRPDDGHPEGRIVEITARATTTYHKLHHFLTAAPWSAMELNQRRLEVMNQCHQTKISRGFSLIIDDSGHRKSGNFIEVVGRQYIGEIGKTENSVVAVTSHLYDGIKNLPLDLSHRHECRYWGTSQ